MAAVKSEARQINTSSPEMKSIIANLEHLCKEIKERKMKITHFYMSNFEGYHPEEAHEKITEHYSKILNLIINSSETLIPRLRGLLYENSDSIGPLICTLLHLSENAKKYRDEGEPHKIFSCLYSDPNLETNELEARLIVLKNAWAHRGCGK